jgi:haloalkane dehalogenase
MTRLSQSLLQHTAPLEPAWLDRRLFPFESRYMDIDGNRIHYIDEGAGPVLLFLHPSPAWSFIYRDIIRNLRSRYRCVALDLPGFGLSRAASDFGFTAREHAHVIEKFMRVRNLEDVVLLGHSQTGPIGLFAAGRVPERLAGLIVLNTFAWRLTRYPEIRRMLWLLNSPLYGLADVAFNASLWYFRQRGINRRLSRGEVAAYYGPFKRLGSRLAHQRTMVSVLEDSFLLEVERSTQRLAGLPTLILFSDDDARRTHGLTDVPSWTERHARTFPNHRISILPSTRHYPQEDAPDAMAAVIDDWHRGSVQD